MSHGLSEAKLEKSEALASIPPQRGQRKLSASKLGSAQIGLKSGKLDLKLIDGLKPSLSCL